jgi:iron complex outermembrane receptor protein
MNVRNIYAETILPFFSNSNARGGLHELSVSLAGRYSDYGAFGKNSNPKVGVTWKPVDSLAVNASYGTSFRVALISADPFAASTVSLASVFDCVRFSTVTCGSAASSAGTNATMTAVGGNADVKPESSRTYTLGLQFKPEFAKGLEASLTYYNIDYKNLISTPGSQAVVSSQILPAAQALYGAYIVRRPSYVTAGADDTAFNALITNFMNYPTFRQPAGSTPAVSAINIFVDSRNSNSGRLKTAGFDVSLGYKHSTGIGDWSYGLVGNYTTKFDRALVTGGPVLDRLGAIDFSVKYRARASLGWRRGAWSANAFINYTPGYKNINVTDTPTIGSYTITDVTFGYRREHYDLSLDIQNVLNKQAPYALIAGGAQNFDSNFASPIGRLANLRLAVSF